MCYYHTPWLLELFSPHIYFYPVWFAQSLTDIFHFCHLTSLRTIDPVCLWKKMLSRDGESVQIWWHVCHCEEHIHHRDSYDTDMHWHAEWLKKLSVFVSIGWSSEIKYLLQFQYLASGNLSELFLPCFMYSFMSVHCVWYIRYFATG